MYNIYVYVGGWINRDCRDLTDDFVIRPRGLLRTCSSEYWERMNRGRESALLVPINHNDGWAELLLRPVMKSPFSSCRKSDPFNVNYLLPQVPLPARPAPPEPFPARMVCICIFDRLEIWNVSACMHFRAFEFSACLYACIHIRRLSHGACMHSRSRLVRKINISLAAVAS